MRGVYRLSHVISSVSSPLTDSQRPTWYEITNRCPAHQLARYFERTYRIFFFCFFEQNNTKQKKVRLIHQWKEGGQDVGGEAVYTIYSEAIDYTGRGRSPRPVQQPRKISCMRRDAYLQTNQPITMLNFCCVIEFTNDCCVNFGRQTIWTTPSARCCDKDFQSNTDIGAALSPQLRIQRIFLAPGCLKLDYKRLQQDDQKGVSSCPQCWWSLSHARDFKKI